jgi:hypothetical protein
VVSLIARSPRVSFHDFSRRRVTQRMKNESRGSFHDVMFVNGNKDIPTSEYNVYILLYEVFYYTK